jgi:hypothetical protein
MRGSFERILFREQDADRALALLALPEMRENSRM